MDPLAPYFQLILLVAILIPAVLFLLTQQRTLEAIRRENRKMSPGQVWLQMIPVFGMIFQFWVVRRIADSIQHELNTPTGDSIFAEEGQEVNGSPTYSLGLAYAILFCCCLIPIVNGICALAGLVVWICYWVQLNRYRVKMKRRLLMQ